MHAAFLQFVFPTRRNLKPRYRHGEIEVVKELEGLAMQGFGFGQGSPVERVSLTQKQRLPSRFHEVMEYRGMRDGLGVPARLCHRNRESRTSVARSFSKY